MKFDKEQTHEGTNVVLGEVELIEATLGEWAEGEALAYEERESHVVPVDVRQGRTARSEVREE